MNFNTQLIRWNSHPHVKIMFVISIALILILTLQQVSAQSDFRNGYYITLQNDTVYGLIDYRGEVKNAQTCIYKKDNVTEQLKFNPGEINAYRFTDGKFYISRQIKTGDIERTVFLEFLVDGITNLYFFRDINNYIYFLEDKNGKMLELSNETITDNVEGKGKVQRNTNRHIGILKATFADCKEIQPQINNVSLGHKSLIKLTKNYHNYVCNDQTCIVYEKTVQPVEVRFASALKAGVANFHFDKGIFLNYNFDPDLFFGAGFLINTVFPGINEKLSFEAGLDFNLYKFHGSYDDLNSSIKELYNVYFDLFTAQPTLAVKYTFPKGTIRPTIAVGGYADIFVGNKQEVITVKQHQDSTYTFKSDETPLTPLVFGGFAQVGLNYELTERTFFTNLRICYSTNQDQGIKSIIQSANLNIGMFLDKK